MFGLDSPGKDEATTFRLSAFPIPPTHIPLPSTTVDSTLPSSSSPSTTTAASSTATQPMSTSTAPSPTLNPPTPAPAPTSTPAIMQPTPPSSRPSQALPPPTRAPPSSFPRGAARPRSSSNPPRFPAPSVPLPPIPEIGGVPKLKDPPAPVTKLKSSSASHLPLPLSTPIRKPSAENVLGSNVSLSAISVGSTPSKASMKEAGSGTGGVGKLGLGEKMRKAMGSKTPVDGDGSFLDMSKGRKGSVSAYGDKPPKTPIRTTHPHHIGAVPVPSTPKRKGSAQEPLQSIIPGLPYDSSTDPSTPARSRMRFRMPSMKKRNASLHRKDSKDGLDADAIPDVPTPMMVALPPQLDMENTELAQHSEECGKGKKEDEKEGLMGLVKEALKAELVLKDSDSGNGTTDTHTDISHASASHASSASNDTPPPKTPSRSNSNQDLAQTMRAQLRMIIPHLPRRDTSGSGSGSGSAGSMRGPPPSAYASPTTRSRPTLKGIGRRFGMGSRENSRTRESSRTRGERMEVDEAPIVDIVQRPKVHDSSEDYSRASPSTPASAPLSTPTPKSKASKTPDPIIINPPPRKAPPEGVPQDVTDDEMPRPALLSPRRMKDLPALPPASPPAHSVQELTRITPPAPSLPMSVLVTTTTAHPVLRRIQTDLPPTRSESPSPDIGVFVDDVPGSATNSSEAVRDSAAYASDAMVLIPDRAIPQSVPTSAVDERLSYDHGIRGSPPSTYSRSPKHVLKSSLSEILKDQILPAIASASVSALESDNGDKHSFDSPALTYASTSASSHSHYDSPVTSISTETAHDGGTAPLVIRRKRFTQRGSGKDLRPPILNPTIRRNKSIPANLNKDFQVRFPEEYNSTTPSTASSEVEFSLALLSTQMKMTRLRDGYVGSKGVNGMMEDEQSDSGSSLGPRVPNSTNPRVPFSYLAKNSKVQPARSQLHSGGTVSRPPVHRSRTDTSIANQEIKKLSRRRDPERLRDGRAFTAGLGWTDSEDEDLLATSQNPRAEPGTSKNQNNIHSTSMRPAKSMPSLRQT